MGNETDYRPWGKYEVLLDDEKCKVKKITVIPGGRLSLQYHNYRQEHWFIIDGQARVTLGKNKKLLKKGDYVDIPLLAHHRVENVGNENLVFIEVQTGESFEEEDIIRLEDDYNRE